MNNNKLYPEARGIIHLSKAEVNEDIHIIKEVYYDGKNFIDKIKIIKDFKRPFYITKKIFRNHVDSKEAESLDKVDKYMSTQSDLWLNVARRIGNSFTGKVDIRKLKSSPYLYGCDVDSRVYLKYMYNKRNYIKANHRLGVFDIEFDVLKNEMIMLSIMSSKKVIVGLLKSFAIKIPDLDVRLRHLYKDFIPENKFKNNVDIEFIVFDTEMDIIRHIFREANYLSIDYLAAWNIKYDLTTILDICEKNNVNPADVFHYDKIPDKYKYFSFKPGRLVKVMESGKESAISIEDQWHNIKSTTNYIFLDAMGLHRQIRTGSATIPGGYNLDNILAFEGIAQKLKFSSNQGFKGIEWHIDMVANKPAEYVIYNIWDIMSIMNLDEKTKDFAVSASLLLENSHFDIFNSGPRKIVDALTFFYLKKGLVLGVKNFNSDNDELLGTRRWILTLQAHLQMDNGMKVLEDVSEEPTLVKSAAYDADAVASYPSNTLSANVSKDTTHRELRLPDSIPREMLITQNLNLMYGSTNAIEYCENMFNMPTIFNLLEDYKNGKLVDAE